MYYTDIKLISKRKTHNPYITGIYAEGKIIARPEDFNYSDGTNGVNFEINGKK